MAVMEYLDGQIAVLSEQVAKIQEVKTQLEGELAAAKAAGVTEGDAVGYERGYAEGKASVVLPSTGTGELLFTQEDMDRVSQTAKDEKTAELQPQIDDLKLQLAAAVEETAKIQLSLDEVKAAQAGAVDGALAAFKAELKAKYDEQQVAETAGETGFAGLLG